MTCVFLMVSIAWTNRRSRSTREEGDWWWIEICKAYRDRRRPWWSSASLELRGEFDRRWLFEDDGCLDDRTRKCGGKKTHAKDLRFSIVRWTTIVGRCRIRTTKISMKHQRREEMNLFYSRILTFITTRRFFITRWWTCLLMICLFVFIITI